MTEAFLQNSKSYKNYISNSVYILLFLLFCRLFAMYFIPLNDSTEARYGEIARIMLETGNWITLAQEYGVPFWAKPPLSSWLSALSMYIFGVNEFAVRLPSLLLSCVVLWLTWYVAYKRNGIILAFFSVVILASSLFFFLDAGTVMTDPALLFCITLTIVSFWQAINFHSKIFGYLFFVALGLGLLAKGPIALVLPGLSLGIWVLIFNKWKSIWQNLPWFVGMILVCVIAFPWYFLAESKTPGFLNYFLVGEHLNRFLEPGWVGDKYGFAHNEPYGMIWLYALVGIFPWSIFLVSWLLKSWRDIPNLCRDEDNFTVYLILCIITPLIFFTFARNIIYPYIFPILPVFALLFAEIAKRYSFSLATCKKILSLSIVTGCVFILATLLFIYKPYLVEKSQKRVVKFFRDNRENNASQLIYWATKADFSARFYTHGKALATQDIEELIRLLNAEKQCFIVIEENKIVSLPPEILKKLKKVESVDTARKKYDIYRTLLIV